MNMLKALFYTAPTLVVLLGSCWLILRTCMPGEEKIITDAFRSLWP